LSIFTFHDPATTQIYTLSLHDALPISCSPRTAPGTSTRSKWSTAERSTAPAPTCSPSSTRCSTWHASSRASRKSVRRRRRCATRSEEHTSELQSPYDLVCRLLLEKKKK